MPINKKLQDLGDQILAQLDRLPNNDGKTIQVRNHIYALLQALGGTPTSTTVPPPQRSVAPASVRLEANRVPRDMAITTPPQNAPGGGSVRSPAGGGSTPSVPHSVRPGLFTERRATRQAAGVTLKQVAAAAGTTLPTARTYEIKRTAVRPDKRQALDAVYEQFKK